MSLTVDDLEASLDFFRTYLGYRTVVAADGFVFLEREDAAVDIVLLRRGIELLPPEQRDRTAAGLILALTVTGIEAVEKRLREAGAPVTMALREEPWGERLFQLTDPNGIVVQLVEWIDQPGAEPEPAGTLLDAPGDAPVDALADVAADGPVGWPADVPAPRVITTSDEHVTETPNARMTGLAAPSRGSTELSTWTVAMREGQTGPEHAISREQVWTVTVGALEVTCGGRTELVAAGRTLVLPPDLVRRIHAPQDAEAHVAMRADGVASVPGAEGTRVIPWAR
ncbi:VOC family protein [Streptomyces sp. NPDC001941]|uniref:VOC family protein n=1 Tax=Streptomyces sp. NPDC001941 TaxID=3154659 RepID=UPI00331F4C69